MKSVLICKHDFRQRRKYDVANLLVKQTENDVVIPIFFHVVLTSSSLLRASVTSKRKR